MNTKAEIKLDANLQPVSESGLPHVFTFNPSMSLLWLKDDAHPERVPAAEADRIIRALRAGGFDDWRLGVPLEQISCVDYGRSDPAANTDLYNVKPDWYWTEQQAAWSASARWCVDFDGGYVYDHHHIGDLARVRAVRSWSGPAPVGQ
jgi:hypothetical protein